MEWLWFFSRIPLEPLSRFCGNMGMCLSAGMTLLTSLRTCHRAFPSPMLKNILGEAIPRVENSMTLSEALEPWHRQFPAFFLPALQCGEQSGRIDETLRYLEKHCSLLAEPTRVMRNTWLMPLCLMLFGSVFCIAAHLVFAPFHATLSYAFSTTMSYGQFAVLVFLVLYIPQLRTLAERWMLVLPLIGPALRELAIHRFFHAMHMLYSTSGMRVESMIRLAAKSAGNSALEEDFLRAAECIERRGTIGEAFSQMTLLPPEYKMILTSGDEAGKLDTAFETVCRHSTNAVNGRLSAFQQVFFRVMTAAVLASIIATLSSLIAMRR
jgi:type IV pilus assembly protein PilC